MPRYSPIRHPYCAAIGQQAGLTTTMELDVDFAENPDLRKSIGVHVKIISMFYARCAVYHRCAGGG
ncbi:hypothetical protein F4604DRAFT_1729310 [Suillus subluteus]|nr:hypothetical protein F4604DRAFT_1729310 [Suillus subluteus]